MSLNSGGVKGIHIVAKPIGPRYNMNCEYCFYLEKQALFPKDEDYVMSDEVLEAYITKYITLQPTPVVGFVWQGGEPTLLGLDFYKKVIELQRHYVDQKEITNSLQTNGTLLDDEWCKFLKDNNFLVGLSFDGPKEIHNRYRKDAGGKGSFDKVMRSLKLLQKYDIEYNSFRPDFCRQKRHCPLFHSGQRANFRTQPGDTGTAGTALPSAQISAYSGEDPGGL